MEGIEIQRVKSEKDLFNLARGDWVEVEGKGEMRVSRKFPRRLQLIAMEGENRISYIDVPYTQIELTPEGSLILHGPGFCTYTPESSWYDSFKLSLEAD